VLSYDVTWTWKQGKEKCYVSMHHEHV